MVAPRASIRRYTSHSVQMDSNDALPQFPIWTFTDSTSTRPSDCHNMGNEQQPTVSELGTAHMTFDPPAFLNVMETGYVSDSGP